MQINLKRLSMQSLILLVLLAWMMGWVYLVLF
jgi:hypothetical protein